MSTIIAARFDTQEDADGAVAALTRDGFTGSDIQTFYLSPAGMHGDAPVVDNERTPVATEGGGRRAAAAAAVGGAVGLAAGIAAAPVVAPAIAVGAAIAGAGVGGYGGALIGGVTGSAGDEKGETGERIERRAGIMVAICADTVGSDKAISGLRAAGALDIERATGTWRDGAWVDFDPNNLPDFIDATSTASPGGPPAR